QILQLVLNRFEVLTEGREIPRVHRGLSPKTRDQRLLTVFELVPIAGLTRSRVDLGGQPPWLGVVLVGLLMRSRCARTPARRLVRATSSRTTNRAVEISPEPAEDHPLRGWSCTRLAGSLDPSAGRTPHARPRSLVTPAAASPTGLHRGRCRTTRAADACVSSRWRVAFQSR